MNVTDILSDGETLFLSHTVSSVTAVSRQLPHLLGDLPHLLPDCIFSAFFSAWCLSLPQASPPDGLYRFLLPNLILQVQFPSAFFHHSPLAWTPFLPLKQASGWGGGWGVGIVCSYMEPQSPWAKPGCNLDTAAVRRIH